MSLWRCSQCHKAGLEDDFVFVAVDEQHEVIMCFDCAPPEALAQTWGDETEDDSDSE